MNDVERLQPVAGIPYRDLSLVIRSLSSVVRGEKGYLAELYEGMPGKAANLLAKGQLPPLGHGQIPALPDFADFPISNPSLKAVVQRGAYIWEQFVGEEVGQCLRAQIEKTAAIDGAKLRLRLCWGADLYSELERSLHLEGLLLKGAQGQPLDYCLLALHPAVAVVRHPLGTSADAVADVGPLRVLIVYANPRPGENFAPVPNLRAQLAAVKECLEELQKHGWIREIRVQENPTPEGVRQGAYAPQVVVFLGHGYKTLSGGRLVLAAGENGAFLVGAELAQAVQGRGLKSSWRCC